MTNIYPAINELKLSKTALILVHESYVSGNDIKVMDEWGAFLTHLNLFWIKTEQGFKDVKNKFQPIQGQFKNKRSKDPMLTYLEQARHAYQHSPQKLIDTIRISDEPFMDMAPVTITSEAGETTSSLFYPALLKVFPITNLNVTYDVPKTHIGTDLFGEGNPFEIGAKAIFWYAQFLKYLYNHLIKKGTYPDLDNLVSIPTWNAILNFRPDARALTKHMAVNEEEKVQVNLPNQPQ